MTEFEQGQIIADVHVGLVPGTPMAEYSKQFAITSKEWHEALANNTTAELLSEFNGKVNGYAFYWMMQPDRVNWVKTEWIYL